MNVIQTSHVIFSASSDGKGMRLKVAEANPPGAMVDIFFRIAGDPGARMARRQEGEGGAEGEGGEGEKKKEAGGTASDILLTLYCDGLILCSRKRLLRYEMALLELRMGEEKKEGEGEKKEGGATEGGEKPAEGGEGGEKAAEGEAGKTEGAPAEGEATGEMAGMKMEGSGEAKPEGEGGESGGPEVVVETKSEGERRYMRWF
ncbi:hypothetical protein P7C70_g2192, partial [Phenoliferia sp. Uapishka_3]